MNIPDRQIRAVYNEKTIRVYQAYADPIANAALSNGTFCSPFKMDRMTWIKPSFLWMMYRCGWGLKEGQNRVLAIDISREGFEWALSHACLSHYAPNVHSSPEAWQSSKDESPVRIQWDPERSATLDRLDYRSIQIGLSGKAVDLYVNEWIKNIEEVTELAKEIYTLSQSAQFEITNTLLPKESSYILPKRIAVRIGADE